ncbi:MBG domain-containing protein [Sphingomonas sp. 8AM]|uniref:MBG domain-containing protein n=1 Tax=Sphingomonas sp. 8AM TaxID=2653170 RepID=UPI0012F2831F|nr:MBG domain-containing protein [Sphingomonas sp. 8AM]VXD01083.1 exported hypothetical protein [Sphingomonas sp. 8AM]
MIRTPARPLPRPLHRPLLAALLASSTLLPATVLAQTLPTDGRVVRGAANIQTVTPDAMTIRQTTDRAVIEWSNFSVAQGARVDIQQNDARSALLNRVTGDTTSTIAGQITANGQVFLVNPNGILITSTGSVKAAGFVASTLDLSNDAFMGGDIVVTGRGGRVTNAGTIDIVKGGYAALIGGRVENSGSILAPLGKVAIGSAQRATLDLEGDGFLQVALPAGGADAGIFASGRIVADGGAVVLAAGAAREAARGVVNLTGSIAARGLAGRNGAVTLTGGEIALAGASIDVSGAHGGGQVRIGGDRQGGGTLTHANTLAVDAATTIRADATGQGDGGRVTLWSDAATHFAGTISATGAGHGGDAEVSGKAHLSYTGHADLRGAGGFGTLLLDPHNVTISGDEQTSGDDFVATADDSVVNVAKLQTALGTANVTVSTGSDGTQDGVITLAAPLAWNSKSTLTLSAAGAIALNQSITAAAGGLTLDAGGTITPSADAAVSVGRFTLAHGDWQQVSATLPAFAAHDFRLTGGTFVRALGGTGASDDAYQLTDVFGLQGIGTLLGRNYLLANDIDASGTRNWNDGDGFAPVGTAASLFTGSINGRGHVVSALTIDRPGTDNVGLIGAQGEGIVTAIGLEGGAIYGKDATGALVGYNALGAVTNAYATTAVSGGKNVGGVVGNNHGTVSLVYASGAVDGKEAVGGLVGFNDHGAVGNSYATGAVSGGTGSNQVGGLIGNNDHGELLNSYATGAVSGTSHVGGLVGADDSGTVTASFWDKDTSGQATSAIGAGLTTAQLHDATNYTEWDFGSTWFQAADLRPILRSELPKDADGSYHIGNVHQLQLLAADLAGNYVLTRNMDATATNGTHAGDIWGAGGFVPVGTNDTPFAGNINGNSHLISGLTINRPTDDNVALVGVLASERTITALGLDGGAIRGRNFVGGLVATNSGTVSNAFATGAVSGETSVGGLVALNYGTVSDSYATGAVSITADGGYASGGLVASNIGTISNAYATGTVSRGDSIGGLAGSNTGTISNAYATGAVSGGSTVGGLIGENSSGKIRNTYATGAVSSSSKSRVGGLVGLDDKGEVTGSYWDKDTTGQNDSALGSGLTTAELQSGLAIWREDADSGLVNAFAGGTKGLYPYLASFFPDGVQAISGTASGTNVAGGRVALYRDGQVLGTASVGANGYYYAPVAAGKLTGPVTLGGVVHQRGVKTAGGFFYADGLALDENSNLSKTDIAVGRRDVTTDATRWSVMSEGLTNAFGSNLNKALDADLLGVAVNVTARGDLLLDDELTAPGTDVRITTPGGISIAKGGSLSGHDLILDGALGFANDGGAKALTATGRWLVFSGSPSYDRHGGLTPDFVQYNATAATTPAQATGNGFLYKIAPKITVELTGTASRAYDGTNIMNLTDANFTAIGGQVGDLIDFKYHVGTVATPNVGDHLLVTVADLKIGDATTKNGVPVYGYSFAAPTVIGAIGQVTPATLTYTAHAASRGYGAANPGLGGDVTGFVAGETLASATGGAPVWSSTATEGSNVGSYAITGGGLTANHGNYVFVQADANAKALTIVPRNLTVAADAITRKYGYANPALTYHTGGDGLYGSDALTGALDTEADEDSDVGRYGITQGSLTAGGNYKVTFSGADLTIVPRDLTIAALEASRAFGEANPVLGYRVAGDGLYDDDRLSGTLATSADASAAAGRYPIEQGSLTAGTNYTIAYTGADLMVTAAAAQPTPSTGQSGNGTTTPEPTGTTAQPTPSTGQSGNGTTTPEPTGTTAQPTPSTGQSGSGTTTPEPTGTTAQPTPSTGQSGSGTTTPAPTQPTWQPDRAAAAAVRTQKASAIARDWHGAPTVPNPVDDRATTERDGVLPTIRREVVKLR